VIAEAIALASTVGVAEPLASAAGAQALAQLRFHAVEELVHARDQALVLEHQRVADHHARHAGVLLAELQQHQRDALGLQRPDSRARTIWLTSVKTLLSMNSISPSNICALLAKWRYSAASRHVEPGGQRGGGDALGAGLLQHAASVCRICTRRSPGFGRLRTVAAGARRPRRARRRCRPDVQACRTSRRALREAGAGGLGRFWHRAPAAPAAGKH
jgi:hypothetical protein